MKTNYEEAKLRPWSMTFKIFAIYMSSLLIVLFCVLLSLRYISW